MTKMMISARVDIELNKKLEALAEATQRSKAFLIIEALEVLIDREAYLQERVAKAVKDADATEHWISHETMGNWINSLDSDSPLPDPVPDVYRPKLKQSA